MIVQAMTMPSYIVFITMDISATVNQTRLNLQQVLIKGAIVSGMANEIPDRMIKEYREHLAMQADETRQLPNVRLPGKTPLGN